MNKYIREQISSLVDDKQSDQGIIDALSRDEDLRRIWAHYHLIGDSLKGHLPDQVDCAIADRIKARVVEEPAIAVPDLPRGGFVQKVFKPVSGFAVAASIAAVVLLGLRQGEEAGTFDSDIVAGNEATNRFTFTANQTGQPTRHFRDEGEARLRLDHYLVNHNEHRVDSGMRGIFPYVRIVAYEAKE